jgi:hypothetical protein
MSTIRREIVCAALHRANALMVDITDVHKRHKVIRPIILVDKSLTNDEKRFAIKMVDENYDRGKIFLNEGTKRTCENCNKKCLATFFCEYCVQNYLKANFSNWSSGYNNIDNLIQICQIKVYIPSMIIEWISYNKLQNIEYITKGGFSDIYTATWFNGKYHKWNSNKRQLKRFGNHRVILKVLGKVEDASQSWFAEVCNLKLFNVSS